MSLESIPWSRVVELAIQVEANSLSNEPFDGERARMLARAVLEFQSQLLGNQAMRRQSDLRR